MPQITDQVERGSPYTAGDVARGSSRADRVERGSSRAATRNLALDAFRGLTMASMVIVNNPGTWSAMYWPLEHAEWNGWTPTDLIFPFFLFIVGISLTLSRRTLDGSVGPIVRRALLLVAFGLLLTGFPYFDLNRWRFTGILPRIAVCYLASALIFRWTAPRVAETGAAAPGRRATMGHAATLVVVTAAIVIGYWLVLTRFGDLTPEGNIGAAIDRRLFGSHLYRRGQWDPEGLLSSLPGVATTLMGVLAGMWLRTASSVERKVLGLIGAGAALMIAGQAWHPWLPINKNLWTSSYVLLTGGAAAIVLAACIQAVDVHGWRRVPHPLVVLGSNAIALFVVSGLIGKAFLVWHLQEPIYEHGFAWMASAKNASLLYSIAFLLLMYGMCDWLYRRNLFLKL